MGIFQSKPAHSHYRLPTLPNEISVHVPARASSRKVSNPASTPARLIDSLLESHNRILRSAMKPKLFRKNSLEYEKSLKDHSVALVRLEATLSGLFEKLSKLGSEDMKFRGWEELDSSLVVIYDELKVASKRAEQVMKSRTENAEIDASTTEVQRLSVKVEKLAEQEWKRVSPTARAQIVSA